MERSDLHHAPKADLHFMKGDRAAMGLWLDTECKKPYIGVCLTRKGHLAMALTERKSGDAGVSHFWSGRNLLDQDLSVGWKGKASNSEWMVAIQKDDVPRSWYIVFDDIDDAQAFKTRFRKGDAA